jgi:hypothetical protein
MSMEEPFSRRDEPRAVEDSFLSLAVEAWRFLRVCIRLMAKLDAGHQKRFVSQVRYFQNQLENNLLSMGYRLIELEGEPFDPGMAVTAVNAGDFSPEDTLVVDQMMEPLIMSDEGIVRVGKALLRKVGKP